MFIVPCAGDMFLTFDSIVCEPVNKTIKNSNAVHMAIRIFVWLLSLAMLLTMFQSILSFRSRSLLIYEFIMFDVRIILVRFSPRPHNFQILAENS